MIRDDEVAALLRAATDDIEVPSAPADELAQAGLHRQNRLRTMWGAIVLAGVVAGGWGIARMEGSQPAVPPTSPSATTASAFGGCIATVPEAVLPAWAREGFSDRRPRIPYVRGEKNEIVAILFAQPLRSPPAAGYNNKILWVSRLPQRIPTALRITARLDGESSTIVRMVSGGPGPSIINLPRPGCWHLTLNWSGYTDHLNLRYVPR